MKEQKAFEFYSGTREIPEILKKYCRSDDPFFCLPEYKYQIGVSGGKTSAYLLYRVLERHGGELPDNAVAIFTNTGKEREETLRFVREIEQHWDVPVVWLEYWRNDEATGYKNDPKNMYKVVNVETASRKGEPFEQVMKVRKTIPGTNQRFCTTALKIHPADRYLKFGLGWKRKETRKMLGIRADESKRGIVALFSDCFVELPLIAADVTSEEISGFWEKQPFQLQVPPGWGNCDLCFMKSINIAKRILKKEPERVKWWQEMEEKHGPYGKRKKQARFRRDVSMGDLLVAAESDETYWGEESIASGISCYCGDD